MARCKKIDAHPLASSQAYKKYNSHKYNAKLRGIQFKLTFDEWNNWWLSNGVDKQIVQQRPFTTKDKLCMCRVNDIGAYELGNIYCDTNSNNVKSMFTDEHREKMRIGVKLYWANKIKESQQ